MAENKEKSWDQSQLRKYNINCDQIPRLRYDDPKVLELILQNVSIFLWGSFRFAFNYEHLKHFNSRP